MPGGHEDQGPEGVEVSELWPEKRDHEGQALQAPEKAGVPPGGVPSMSSGYSHLVRASRGQLSPPFLLLLSFENNNYTRSIIIIVSCSHVARISEFPGSLGA